MTMKIWNVKSAWSSEQSWQDEGRRQVRHGKAKQDTRDQAGADHAPLDHHRAVHDAPAAARISAREEIAGRQDRDRPECQRCEQEPGADRGEARAAAAAARSRSADTDPRSRRTVPRCRCRGTATGRAQTRADHRTLIATRGQQHRRCDQQPSRCPEQDEGFAPVGVLQEEQAAHNRRAEGAGAARADRDGRRLGNGADRRAR